MKLFKPLAVACLLILSGCASNIPPVLLMPENIDVRSTPLTDRSLGEINVEVSESNVDSYINAENFSFALKETLIRSRIFGGSENEQINIDANIVEADFPDVGSTMKSTLGVHYVISGENGHVLLDETITYTGEASGGEEFYGSARSLLALKRAQQGHFDLLISSIENALSPEAE